MVDDKKQQDEPAALDLYVLNSDADARPFGFVGVAEIEYGWSIAMTFEHDRATNLVELTGLNLFDNTRSVAIGHPQRQTWMATPARPGQQASWATWITSDSLPNYPKPPNPRRPRLRIGLIKSLPLGKMEQAVRSMARDAPDVAFMFQTEAMPVDVMDTGQRTGRRGHKPRYYAEVARLYVKLLNSSEGDVHGQLADHLGVARSTARDTVEEARVRGLLTRPGRGRRSTELTDQARRLLDDAP